MLFNNRSGAKPEMGSTSGEENEEPRPVLSLREIEILSLLEQGFTVRDIADKLILSAHTIRTHRNNIRKKMGCRNTTQMVAKAIRAGWI